MQKTTQKCNGDLATKKPKDYIIATGQAYSVKQFVEIASNYLEMKIFWSGKGLNEIGYIKKMEKNYNKN